VFSLEECQFCVKAKALLRSHGLDFTDISLTTHPSRRRDMASITGRLTVPQIFFGTLHIGGFDELHAIHKSGGGGGGGGDGAREAAGDETVAVDVKEFESIEAALVAAGELPPADGEPRLRPTDESTFVAPAKASELSAQPKVCLGNVCSFTYSEIMAMLENELDIKNRTYHLQTYRRCFVGSEAVDWCIAKFPRSDQDAQSMGGKSQMSRAEAVQILSSLQRLSIFRHVTDDHAFEDRYLFYRLSTDEDRTVLNDLKQWDDRVDPPMVIVGALKSMMRALKKRHRQPGEDGLIDYLAMANDPDFVSFRERTCELQRVDLTSLPVDERAAFLINTYNLMVPHAFAQVGVPTSNLKRAAFFDSVKYNIGGLLFSFNDIESGVLRANRHAPYHLNPPFKRSGDDRLSTTLPECLPQIHFALNCGARSCPPIKNYSAEALHDELRISAMAFFEHHDHCRIDSASNTLWLSKILSWYKRDFGQDPVQRARFVAGHLTGDKLKALEEVVSTRSFTIRYLPYDWTSDASPNHKVWNK